MPGPPPPPPPTAPPVPSFSPAAPQKRGGGDPDDRSALLKSIRQGAKLKKTVTVDKSAPLVSGKVSNTVGSNNSPAGGSNISSAPKTPNGLPLGGLFAGGIPKLRPTGKLGASSLSVTSNNNNNNNNVNSSAKKNSIPKSSAPTKNFDSIQSELKKQLANPSDTRNRGPPPPAPARTISSSTTALNQRPMKEAVSNGFHPNQSSLHHHSNSVSNIHVPNNSTLHRKAKSNVHLNAVDNTDSVNPVSKPVINHGKPNLAPKPPALNGKPAPPKKLLINGGKPVSRAQSMYSPRTPSPAQSPDAAKFGTVRHMSNLLLSQGLTPHGQNSPRPKLPLNGRPSVPPPSIPAPAPAAPLPPAPPSSAPPSVPSSKPVAVGGGMRPPNHAPPPPPTHAPPPAPPVHAPPPVPPQHAPPPAPPSHAPPPPPYKTQQQQPARPPPMVPNTVSASNNAPPPPPRHSSMRDRKSSSTDLEERFKNLFQSPDKFPNPPPYRSVLKLYSNQRATSSKQQAPLPPPHATAS